MPDTIVLEHDGDVARVRLNRPDVRNALDTKMIAEITETFRALSGDTSVRCVVLDGAGKAFSGGADINYMRASLDLGEEENFQDALRLSVMFGSIEDCAAPVIAVVHGAALGGGSGLIAACDIVLSADDAVFGFTEVKLGIVPAVISPYVVRKIGMTHARALFVTGERFGAERALRIGLVHEIVPQSALADLARKKVDELRTAGPHAARVAKQIARSISQMAPDDARAWTARTTAARRASDEGQEGLRAFLEKRKPAWQ
jgi:methylglutaconyl-CoA hydratase